MSGLKHLLKNLASLMAFTVAICTCFLMAGVFYKKCSSWSTDRRSLFVRENARSHHVPRILKRTTDPHNRFHYYENCILATPSRDDIRKLCADQECSTVHCIRSCLCGDSTCQISSRTTCFTRACTKFGVKVGLAENEVPLERFSDVLDDYLSRLQDTKEIEVTCSDNNSHLLDRKLDLEITRNDLDACTLDGVTQSKHIKTTKKVRQANRTKTDVFLIYFRLMSKWESFVKLPRLNSLIEHKRNDVSWNLHSFDNMQSNSFVLDENLRSVLGMASFSSTANRTELLEEGDLIQLAIKDGKCVFFHALTCHKSGIYRDIEEVLQAANDGKCRRHEDKLHETRLNLDSNNHTFCDDNKMDDDVDDILNIHDRIGQIYPPTESNSFSVFVINIPDLKSTEAFDTAISGMVTRVLSQPSNILVLMSDVGDPKYSRLDETVFLRTQVFNPLLHIFVSTRTEFEYPAISLLISELKIKSPKTALGLSFVHNMIHKILSGKEVVKAPANVDTFLTTNQSSRITAKDETVKTVCPMPRVSGPVECVCEGRHVRFPNDSTQVAFASFLVGKVNNKLLELSSLNNLKFDRAFSEGTNPRVRQLFRNRFTCDRLYGVCATNVNHVLWKRSTFILMTLYLRPTTRLYSPTIRLEAEVEYSTDDTYNTNFTINILHPTKLSLEDLTNSTNINFRTLFHLLCQDPSDITKENPNHGQFLHAISSEINFGAKAKTKSLHYPCLYLLTRSHGHSADLEVANVCTDRFYNVTVSIDYVNILSLVAVPAEITVGARQVKYVTTLVKNGYWVSVSGYRVHASYDVTIM